MLRAIPGKNFLPPLLAAGCSIAISIAAQRAVQLEHNWGFEAVGSLIGQAKDSGQWLGAVVLQGAIPCSTAGLSFGYLKQHYKGKANWYWLALLLMFWPCLILLFESITEWQPIYESIWLMGPISFINLLIFAPSMFVGQALFRELGKRTRPWFVLLPGIIAIALLWIAGLADHLFWGWQLALDAVVIASAAASVVYLNRCKSISKALLCSLFALLPFVFFDLANCLFNLTIGELSLLIASGRNGIEAVEQDGIRAQFSAVLISICHIFFATVGAALGVIALFLAN